MYKITKKWDEVLQNEYQKEYFIKIEQKIDKLYQTKTIYPKKDQIYKALQLTDYDKIKVVILGQDPYHGENQAEGLAFSVKKGTKIPPSLRNIYKELNNDLNIKTPNHGSLIKWANEGVLLLNTILTVEKNKPLSHKELGWETFTDEIIKQINKKEIPIVFILWGNYAKTKQKLITNTDHKIITSAHPSPFSAYNGFFNSKPFSKTNKFLIEKKISPIDFSID